MYVKVRSHEDILNDPDCMTRQSMLDNGRLEATLRGAGLWLYADKDSRVLGRTLQVRTKHIGYYNVKYGFSYLDLPNKYIEKEITDEEFSTGNY